MKVWVRPVFDTGSHLRVPHLPGASSQSKHRKASISFHMEADKNHILISGPLVVCVQEFWGWGWGRGERKK